MPNVVLLCGAGASLSGVKSDSTARCPPLDRPFFKDCHSAKILTTKLRDVREYVKMEFGFDILDEQYDSFEHVMSTLYTDILTQSQPDQAGPPSYKKFVNLVEILSERLSKSTNANPPQYTSNLTRVIRSCYERSKGGEFSILTFNYDIQVELSLYSIAIEQKRPAGFQFNFPHCYGIESHSTHKLELGDSEAPAFECSTQSKSGIDVLKLHGSLNWDSGHNRYPPPMSSVLEKSPYKRKISITNTRELSSLPATMWRGGRRVKCFPVIVPPIYGKSHLMHNEIRKVWRKAEQKLSQADKLVVFGYSCPDSDQEARNLIRRCTSGSRRNKAAKDLLNCIVVIDPDISVARVLSALTRCKSILWYRDACEFLAGHNW